MPGVNSGVIGRYRRLLDNIRDAIIVAGNRFFPGRLIFDEQQLMDEARQQTGLHDFGDDSFREPLRAICEGFNRSPWQRDAQLVFRNDLMLQLTNKLRIQAEISANPEILQQEVREPIFIAGEARTGTTFLHRLLAQDPATRVLSLWEILLPVPPPERETYQTDPRIAVVEKWLDESGESAPDAIHQFDARAPEECWRLMANELRCDIFALMFREYAEWYETQDPAISYRNHKRQLQLLQSRYKGERWLLKDPCHLSHLKALFSVYPDAKIIQTHRDPVEALPSAASLITRYRRQHYDSDAAEADGQLVLAESKNRLLRGMEARLEEEQRKSKVIFVDVHYTDLITEAMDTVEKIYEKFAIGLSEKAAQCMSRFLIENPRHKSGKHQYSLEQFGLDTAMIHREFEWYYDYFSVPRSTN